MIISNSSVALEAKRSYSETSQFKSIVLEERADNAFKLDTSENAKKVFDQVEIHQQEKEKLEKKQEKERNQQFANNLLKQMQKNNETQKSIMNTYDNEDSITIKLLRNMIKNLNKKYHIEDIDKDKHVKKTLTPMFSISSNKNNLNRAEMEIMQGSPMVSKMVRTTVTSSFESYSENTAFVGEGKAVTKDGREISFNVSLELSQSFTREYSEFSQQSHIYVDPLVINFDSSTANISDKKFLFDLDCDGKKDNISFAENGSGFLTYDKNGDGVVNDGSELFGVKSGDGFRDLAEYDEDKNGWIDEADEIFNKLKIWTKDDKGNDRYISLKDADVGAIFLGSADTQFSLINNSTYNHNGELRKTGVFLKESGGAGTVQHIDLAL